MIRIYFEMPVFCFRPFFTYYVSFVQIVVLIVMVSVYSFAPVGTSKKIVQEEVCDSFSKSSRDFWFLAFITLEVDYPEFMNLLFHLLVIFIDSFLFIILHSVILGKPYGLFIGLPGKGDPGTTGGKSAKIEEECAPVPGSFWSSGPFFARGLGTFSGVSGWLPLSHCLSDLPRVETLLSDNARRLGELINFNVKSCDSSRYPWGPHPGKADDRCITLP